MYSREDYFRTPSRGLRQRLRIALRRMGFIGTACKNIAKKIRADSNGW